MIKNIEVHLRDACQLTGAHWAVIADRERGGWIVANAHSLTKNNQKALVKFLSQPEINIWLEGAFQGKEMHPVLFPENIKLDAADHLYGYPMIGISQVLLVGANHRNATERRIWGLVANLLQSQTSNNDIESYLPNFQTELAYDLPKALDRVLTNFVRVAKPQGAWLAIRRGDMLDIAAQWNDTRVSGLSISIEMNSILRRLNRTLADLEAISDQPEWQDLPHLVRKSTKYWICLPLVIGQRLIGAVALWGQAKFSLQELIKLKELAKQVSPSVEIIVTFNELTGHLGRMAMLNDFALTISSAQNLDQIARRVFGHLARSFDTELISLYLPSTDGRLVREFRNRDGKFSSQSTSSSGHYIFPFLKGRVLRIGDSAPDFNPVYTGSRSALVVPLKYRSQTNGLLAIESLRPDAFSQYDEHLMVVIASHMAGLIEYSRLREEAEARARNLGLIHEVVQQIIGLNDKKEVTQITADLLAQYFAYELAGVMIVGDNPDSPIFGFGGSRAELVQNAVRNEDFTVIGGITGHVFNTGENLLVNDTSQDERYKPITGWEAGSEMCVALKDGDRILGFIDVESSQRNAFSNNDLLAMESLAGVLATVVSGAIQYERLQETIRQLRAAQVESRVRLVAQQDAENRLLQAAKLAAVGEMAAGIAHELNNPLTTVTGFTELILDEMNKDAPHRADVEMVLHEALRARGVVRRLLDFARQGERTRARADINQIIDDVLALTTNFIHTNGVQLEVDFKEDLPWVSVDTNQMKQVFLNLVHNALQAMPTGGYLQIKTGTRSKENRESVIVSIKDSGIGIDPKDIDRIFEPFFTTKGSRGGTGLGLSVTYGIVTDHGGTIEVESQPGEGSIFTVWLPI
jgi:signal transduction histidine kinase